MALIKCEECGQMVSSKASCCPNCGCPIEKKLVCEECGAEIPETSISCPNCGCPIEKRIVCEECGELISPTMDSCPKCGCPIKRGIVDEYRESKVSQTIDSRPNYEIKRDISNNSATKQSALGFVIAFAIIAVVIALFYCFDSCTHGHDYTEGSYLSIPQKLEMAKTIEEADSLLNNTTWHYTDNTDNQEVDYWIKVVFKDGRYTHYAALPSDGMWTMKGEGEYEIKEGRYSNTGDKYIAVYWQGGNGYSASSSNMQYALVLSGGFQFSVCVKDVPLPAFPGTYDYYALPSITSYKKYYGVMKFGDYKWN